MIGSPSRGSGQGGHLRLRIRMAKDTGIQVGIQISETDKPHPRALSDGAKQYGLSSKTVIRNQGRLARDDSAGAAN